MIKLEITVANPFKRDALRRRRRPYMTAAAFFLLPMLAFASPVTIPNQFADGDPLSAATMNANFDAVATAVNDNDTRITALEAGPTVTVRKATGTTVAIAFCEPDEIMTGGGCFMPPENDYDANYANYATYYTGSYPRVMVGITSVPVAAGTTTTDIRPLAADAGQIPFPGDIVSANNGEATVAPGAGWACRPGTVDHDDAGGAQHYGGNQFESWFFPVKAYAVCMQQ